MRALETKRSALFLALARRYGRRRLRRSFEAFLASDLDAVRRLASETPLVVAANHVAFWDPFLVVALDEALGTESYCLMDAHNLARLPFFGWIGAVALDRSSPRAALAHLHASAALADRPGRLLWIFPQGRQRPADARPLGLEHGVRLLARDTGLPVLPVAFDYRFHEAPRPYALARIGEPFTFAEAPGAAFLPELERRLVEGLERTRLFADAGPSAVPELRPLVGRGPGERLPFGARLLGWLGGGRRARQALPAAADGGRHG